LQAALHQGVDNVRADETCSACDQNFTHLFEPCVTDERVLLPRNKIASLILRNSSS
jgi:hypothetical protein